MKKSEEGPQCYSCEYYDNFPDEYPCTECRGNYGLHNRRQYMDHWRAQEEPARASAILKCSHCGQEITVNLEVG